MFEFLLMSDPQRELVTTRASATELKRLALQEGMQELRTDGIRKAARGITSLEEVLRATQADVG
jgi:type II secretory ATPase GspE/PulE/Tfp pilus assembly ATPase PilB-like protein